MYQNPICKFTYTLSNIAAIVGIIAYFINPTITIICGIITFIDSLVQIFLGNQNNITTEIVTIIIGLIVALIIDVPVFACICFALCIGSLLMLLLALLLFLFVK